MTDNKPSAIDRRQFLRNTGIAVGGASVGIPGAAVARRNNKEGSKVTGHELKQVLENPKVQTLSDELGGLHLKRGKARKLNTSVGAGNITSMLIPSQLGVLGYASTDRGFDNVYFFFGGAKGNGRIPPGHLKHLPKKYRDLPGDTDAALTLDSNGNPVLRRAGFSNTQASTESLEQNTLIDDNDVSVVESIHNGNVSVIKEYKRGPKAGEVHVRELGDVDGTKATKTTNSGVEIQTVSSDGYVTADVPDALQFVERYNLFTKKIGGCSAYSDYQHRFAGLSIDLNRLTNSLTISGLTALIGYLIEGSLIAAGLISSGVGVAAFAGAVAGALIAQFAPTTSYTVGYRDFDQSYLLGTLTSFIQVLALEYNASASDTIPASAPSPTHPLRFVL